LERKSRLHRVKAFPDMQSKRAIRAGPIGGRESLRTGKKQRINDIQIIDDAYLSESLQEICSTRGLRSTGHAS
jgi:hypothetical protein